MNTPGLRVLGPVVQLEGDALRSAAQLLAWAVRDHQHRALTLPPHAIELTEAALRTAHQQQQRTYEPAKPVDTTDFYTSREVAHRLGVGLRRAQRLAARLDATRHRGQLHYPRHTVHAYELERSTR